MLLKNGLKEIYQGQIKVFSTVLIFRLAMIYFFISVLLFFKVINLIRATLVLFTIAGQQPSSICLGSLFCSVLFFFFIILRCEIKLIANVKRISPQRMNKITNCTLIRTLLIHLCLLLPLTQWRLFEGRHVVWRGTALQKIITTKMTMLYIHVHAHW